MKGVSFTNHAICACMVHAVSGFETAPALIDRAYMSRQKMPSPALGLIGRDEKEEAVYSVLGHLVPESFFQR